MKKIMAIINMPPLAVMAMMLATTPALPCSAVVVNTPHETIAYTCWAANLTAIPQTPPVYDYTPKPKAKKRSHKCWYTNKYKKRRWRRC